MNGVKLFTGSANEILAHKIISRLDNVKLGRASIGKFSDKEVQIEINENVRGHDCFILQPTCFPTNDNLMELLCMIDALKWSSAARITAVVPYFGYARQDKRPKSARVPITARLAAKMIGVAGADRVLTVDLHSDQIQGFFDIPVDNLYAAPLFAQDLQRYPGEIMVVTPDVGGVLRARAVAQYLEEDGDLAIIDKRRPKPNMSKVMHVIGDVQGKNCVMVDDLVDTAGTLCNAATALKDHGAITVKAYCTHPVLSGNAVTNLHMSVIDELVVTDSIPLSEDALRLVAKNKLRQISLDETLAETITRIHKNQSVSSVFCKMERAI